MKNQLLYNRFGRADYFMGEKLGISSLLDTEDWILAAFVHRIKNKKTMIFITVFSEVPSRFELE